MNCHELIAESTLTTLRRHLSTDLVCSCVLFASLAALNCLIQSVVRSGYLLLHTGCVSSPEYPCYPCQVYVHVGYNDLCRGSGCYVDNPYKKHQEGAKFCTRSTEFLSSMGVCRPAQRPFASMLTR